MARTRTQKRKRLTIAPPLGRKLDAALVTRLGVPIGPGLYVLEGATARAEIARRRREIAALERLGRRGLAYPVAPAP